MTALLEGGIALSRIIPLYSKTQVAAARDPSG